MGLADLLLRRRRQPDLRHPDGRRDHDDQRAGLSVDQQPRERCDARLDHDAQLQLRCRRQHHGGQPQRHGLHYRYNNRARLDRLTIGSTVTADYTYDGLERLAVRATQNMTPAGTTHYVYDRQGHLIVEASGSGSTVREYVWFDDMPLAVVADVDTVTPKLWYVHADHLNRPLKMTDGATKAVVWDAIYRPFGEIVSITGSASDNLRFPGQYFLIESGLHYNWHRHYDPTVGRYLQADPLGGGNAGMGDTSLRASALLGLMPSPFQDGPSIYAYAKSNPTQITDLEGTQAQICVIPGLCPAIAKTIEMCIAVGAGMISTMARPTAGTCSCQHRDIFTSGGMSCQTLRENGTCQGPYKGTGTDTASCQADARNSAPAACRGCLGHCLFRR
jgi:RHS repeat-associated protein